MKKSLLLLPLLLLTSCKSMKVVTDDFDYSGYKTHVFYSDLNAYQTEEYTLEAVRIDTSLTDKRISIILNLTTHLREEKLFTFLHPVVTAEDDGDTISPYLQSPYDGKHVMGPDRYYATVSYSFNTPTAIEDEKYYFSVCVNEIRYVIFLYEKPDELREDLVVQYCINYETIHQDTVKRGRTIGYEYVYDHPDHLRYVDEWKDQNGRKLFKDYRVLEHVVATGEYKNNLFIEYRNPEREARLKYIEHVPSDGVVVVAKDNYYKTLDINYGAISKNSLIKEVYLPSSVTAIYGENFTECENLKTIYYEGSEEEWSAIPKYNDLVIPSNINIVFNTAFQME